MLESQIDQQERKQTLCNDLTVRQEQEERRGVFAPNQSLPREASTLHQHAIADAETPRGRFSAVSAGHVVGSTATPQYPAASAHQYDPCGPEPPLSYDNPALDPGSDDTQATRPTLDDAPSTPLGQRDVGSLPAFLRR